MEVGNYTPSLLVHSDGEAAMYCPTKILSLLSVQPGLFLSESNSTTVRAHDRVTSKDFKKAAQLAAPVLQLPPDELAETMSPFYDLKGQLLSKDL